MCYNEAGGSSIMKKINYDSIKKNIKKNQHRYILITRQISNPDVQKVLLKKCLSESRLMDINIDQDLFVMELGDLMVFDYKTGIDKENHLIIANPKSYDSIFELSSKKNMHNGNGVIVEETKIYNQDKKLLFAKKEINKFVNNQVINRQVILTEKKNYSCEYVISRYEFMYHGKECAILGTNGHYKLLGENSFTNRLELANLHIQKLDNFFEIYLKSSFGLEETKIYQIKRKVKK